MENVDEDTNTVIRSLDRIIDDSDRELREQNDIIHNISEQSNGYPHILDPKFNVNIAKKREFSQYKHNVDYTIPIEEMDDEDELRQIIETAFRNVANEATKGKQNISEQKLFNNWRAFLNG